MTAFKLFKKDSETQKPKEKAQVSAPVSEIKSEPAISLGSASVLKRFYISEKASRLLEENKYVFEVAKGASKQEIKKQIERRFHVHVTGVHTQTMPTKKRQVGRYAGTRSGFRKAIVAIKDGETISQVKAWQKSLSPPRIP